MSTLPLSDIVNISVVVSPAATIGSNFNLGLIVGTSTIISASDRVKVYTGLSDMINAGFTSIMPEYKAAQIYFSQSSQPTQIAVGRWDKTGSETEVQAVTACRQKNTDWYACYLCNATKTNIEAISAYVEAAQPSSVFFYTTVDSDVLAGTDGNIMKVLKAAGYMRSIGQYSSSGDILTAGKEASAGSPSTDISGTTSPTFKIAVDGDVTSHSLTLTPAGLNTGILIAAAMQVAIRALSGAYAAMTVTFTNNVYVITSGTVGINSKVRITNGATNDVAAALKIGAANSAVDTDGSYTSGDAAVAIMGYAMGANTGLANTAYILAYKAEVGATPELLTEDQITIINNQNGNYYINRGNTSNMFQQGVSANGTHFDELINLDMLKSDIQLAVINLLTGVSKVPQTESGVTLLISVIAKACNKAKDRGFLAPGVWNAPSILSLNTGDALSQGYIILAASIASQSEDDRANRIAPPIYVCVKLAGAIEFVTIQVNVNR